MTIEYLKKAEKEGFSVKYLEDLAEVVDMFAFYLRFQEARELVEGLYFDSLKSTSASLIINC